MRLFKAFAAVSILWVGLNASLHAETIGTPAPLTVVDSYDGLAGQVFIFDGSPLFTAAANVVSFDFGGDSLDKSLTPLLFERGAGPTFTLRGVGASIVSAGGTQIQTGAFSLLAGSGSVSAGYTFGYYDGVFISDGGGGVIVDSANAGVLTTITGGGPWRFTAAPSPYTNLYVGAVWAPGGAGHQVETGDGTSGNPYHLPGINRRYQMNMTSVSTAQPGDFDADGDVDGADFVAWQTHFPTSDGAVLADGDADADSDVDGADFVVWQTNFPFTPNPGVASVPEPMSLGLAILGGAIVMTWHRRRRQRESGEVGLT